MPDQIYSVTWNGKEKVKYTYDGLGRLETKKLANFENNFTYENVGEKETTTLVKSVTTTTGTLTYEYDNLGNITSISDGTYTTSYEYDSLNQLTRVNDEKAGKTTTYSYTNGNITECNEYAYTTAELGEASNTKTWSYNDSTWSDLLTDYNGTAITYDEIGNPLTIGSKSLEWTGRQLQSITDGENTYSYAYNGDGNRVSKTVNGTTTEYFYNGSILAGQKTGDDTLVFMYDNNSDIFGFIYENTEYYYIKNVQNDVIAIADKDGNVLVNYTYDAWGKVTLITNGQGIDINDLKAEKFDPTTGEIIPEVDENGEPVTSASTSVILARINPILYCSYYYDKETEWYYLNTRYYSPDMCRFINADDSEILFEDQDSLLEHNLFSYCLNNPTNMQDANGDIAVSSIIGGIVGGAAGAGLGYLLAKHLGLTGWKKAALIAAATVGGAALGAFLGPYVAKLAKIAGSAIKSTGKTIAKKIVRSTGRTKARNLTEQLFMKQVKSNPLKGAKHLKNIVLNDSRWKASKGWIKMQQTYRAYNGKTIVIHFVYNTITGRTADFKFK